MFERACTHYVMLPCRCHSRSKNSFRKKNDLRIRRSGRYISCVFILYTHWWMHGRKQKHAKAVQCRTPAQPPTFKHYLHAYKRFNSRIVYTCYRRHISTVFQMRESIRGCHHYPIQSRWTNTFQSPKSTKAVWSNRGCEQDRMHTFMCRPKHTDECGVAHTGKSSAPLIGWDGSQPYLNVFNNTAVVTRQSSEKQKQYYAQKWACCGRIFRLIAQMRRASRGWLVQAQSGTAMP
jgi:hypothetical protein